MSTRDSRELAAAVAREIEASSRTSRTPPGPTENASPREPRDPALIEAINQVFALFRLNYHNQYYAAFSDESQLSQIKKLWLESLHEYAPAQILHGARRAIESSDYLPTLNRMLGCCDDSLEALGLPSVADAYVEAANSGSPPESQHWSHAAVYWAGRDCGWRRLATTSAKDSQAGFAACYRRRCAAVLRGETLPEVPPPESPALEAQALPPEQALEKIRRIREESGL